MLFEQFQLIKINNEIMCGSWAAASRATQPLNHSTTLGNWALGDWVGQLSSFQVRVFVVAVSLI